jgi:hypothetical protein
MALAPAYGSAEIRLSATDATGAPLSIRVTPLAAMVGLRSVALTAATRAPFQPNSAHSSAMRCAAPTGLIQPWLDTIRVPRFMQCGRTARMRSSSQVS